MFFFSCVFRVCKKKLYKYFDDKNSLLFFMLLKMFYLCFAD